ncbi:transglutaminase domain-containing protein [Microbacterium sp. CH-015]|uniref:transglutaminase domain-containing protein n=1 Tax=Microbacterium sp. CH-015 TaxID=3406734 RepID=UPI003C7922A0
MKVLAGAIYVAVAVVLAAVAAWPIYRSLSFVVLVAAASLIGAGIAVLVRWRQWNGWAAAGLVTAAVLLVGVPLAVPSRLGPPDQLLHGLGELIAGALFGWKDLLTVDLPVGSYRNLLVPGLIVFLVGTASALLLAWRTDTLGVLAVAVGVGMSGFGLLFGRTEVSAPLTVGPLTLAAPVETAVGIGSLLAGVLWLAWRSRDERVRALRRATARSGVRVRRPAAADARRAALGAGMVVVAAAAALAVPATAASGERVVLREATGPRVELSRAVSPLASYRALFADGEIDQVLFSATGDATPERVRLAVLDRYDGAVFRTDASAAGSPFVRLASARDAGAGTPVDADVVIGALGAPGQTGLAGLWMPSAGVVGSVTFEGARAAALADGFYVSDELSAAVQTAGWAPGDAYRLQAAVPEAPALAEASAPGGQGSIGGAGGEDAVAAPASLRTWVQAHVSGTGGAALEGLVSLLRDRGYLSHALTEPAEGTAWMSALGAYEFAPSASGHSLARIDEMFTALLEREADPRAAASDNYVAAVGDDEQFAVATALIARELGFPSRVVVGTRLTSDDPDAAVCAAGVCHAGDVSAWVEVRASTGDWIPVDVTPQHAQAPSRELTEQPDPTIGTAVRPDGVDEVQPPRPAQEDSAAPVERDEAVDLEWLWATLRISGIVLGVALVVLGPFLLVVGAKALRRRGRRRAAAPAARIAGGWEEFLDAAADAGRTPPAAATRTEVAAALATPASGTLAVAADAAVFSGAGATDDEAAEFWRIVDAERAGFAPTGWRRLRAAVSLRSFVPASLVPAALRRTLRRRRSTSSRLTHTERGSRAASTSRRTA